MTSDSDGNSAGVGERGQEEGAILTDSLFRGVGKHAVIYGLGMVLSRAVSFLMLPVYTRYLSPADYGVMALVEMTLDFISIIGGSQLALGVFRFYHKTDQEEAKRQIVATSFLLVGALYVLVGAGVFLAAGPLSELLFGDDAQTLVIRVAALNLTVGALSIVPMSAARVKDLSVLFVGVNLAKLLLAVSFNILFIVVMELGVVGIFLSSLISNALIGSVMVIWLLRNFGTRPSTKWTRDLLRYGVPLMGMQVATFTATFSDRYFLQALSDESLVGLYSLAYQFGFLLVMVGFTPVDMVWGPKRFEIARMDKPDELLARGFVLINVLLLTTALGITLFVGDVLRIMATPAFHSAADVVPLILIAYVFLSWATVQDVGILLRERTEFLTLANVLSATVAVVGYALLIPRYLEWGAAIATVLSFATKYVLTYQFSQRLWRVRYRWTPVWVLVGWTLAISGVGLMLPEMPVVKSLAVRIGLVCLFLIGLWRLPVLQQEDRESLIRWSRDLRSR